jgi:8-oxo-dGTP pyrophosphatase MutT (NUDIX family)
MNLSFFHKLKEHLQSDLPGLYAQNKMSPSVRFTGKIPPSNKLTRESSVLILLYPKDNEIFIPFIQRPTYNGVHSGQVSLPGGKQEPTDSNLLQTALRETNEEIGINIEDINIIGKLSHIHIPNSNFNVWPYVGYTTITPIFFPDPIEVKSIIEAPLHKLLKPTTIEFFERKINGHTIKAPYFNINNYQIWGATAMIVSELIDIIQNNNLIASDSYNAHNAQESQ